MNVKHTLTRNVPAYGCFVFMARCQPHRFYSAVVSVSYCLQGDLLKLAAGAPHDLSQDSVGCAFEPRCDERMLECLRDYPGEFVTLEGEHSVRCFKYSG